MSKPLTPKELHPVIFNAFDHYGMSVMGSESTNPDLIGASTAHHKAWFNAYGKSLWWVLAASVGTGFLTWGGSALLHFQKAVPLGSIIGVLSSLVYATILFIHNSRKATPEEIEALLPVLKLSPVQRAYCLSVVTVYKSNLISDIDRDQIRTALTGLVDQAHKLELQVEKTNGLATGSDTIQLQQEINDVDARIAEALDPEVVKTLEETRLLLQKRLARVSGQGNGAGRAAAQIELIRQSFLSFSEEFDTTFQTTTVAPAMTSDLRKLLHRIQDQTDAVTKAVQEIQQL